MLARTPTALGLALFALLGAGCGGNSAPPKTADDEATAAPPKDDSPAAPSGGDSKGPPGPGTADDSSSKSNANPCTGFEMDLMNALIQSACELQGKPDAKPKDTKDVLTVTATADSARVAGGGHADILVTYANKSAAPLTLDFTVDPTPRFSVEAFNAKTNKRVDLPAGPQPKLPAGMPPREPGEAKIARITLAPNGKATVHVGWDASRTRWAPEKLKGTPPEMGYPRAPAGALPKGKYNLRVVTPLANVFEGIDHEVSAPRTTIDVQ